MMKKDPRTSARLLFRSRASSSEVVLREKLLDTQFELIESRKPAVLVIIAGLDKTGKAEAINQLNKWLDIHHVRTIAGLQSCHQRRNGDLRMQKYWLTLPPAGDIGVYYGGWYEELFENLKPLRKRRRRRHAVKRICRFEQQLHDEGILILKFWFQLSYDQIRQRRRLQRQDPQKFWRLAESLPIKRSHYQEARQRAAQLIRKTDTEVAPWQLIADTDPDARRLLMVANIQQAIQKHVQKPDPVPAILRNSKEVSNVDKARLSKGRIAQLDPGLALDKDVYRDLLHRYQHSLHDLCQEKRLDSKSVIAVFEGNDAAGKGGAIRRVAAAVEAAQCRVVQVAAPTDEELARPYLWRFWRQLPDPGSMTLFDRSWYGRVLVERVEQLCRPQDWQRAYGEINDFEKQLHKAGILVVKFWLAIDKDEQLRRFEARQQEGHKRYKLTAEDWRNRDKWELYLQAAEDMFDATDTHRSPWHLVAANDKRYARIKVLQVLCERIQAMQAST